MEWQKRGIVYEPDGRKPWSMTYASNPVGVPIDGTLHRVYFASRDERNRSHVGFVDLDLDNPGEILGRSTEPVLAPGPLGYFDDHGVYAMSVVNATNDDLWMYYIGWNPGPPPVYYPSIGLAISGDGGKTFTKASPAPIMARSEVDPWMVSSPYVLREGERWRMWYLSGLGWKEHGGQLHSYYHTKYAESDDGVHWRRQGRVALELEPGEFNIARFCVMPSEQGYRGWYSVNRGDGYRIGYAESPDGLTWNRLDDQVGIDVSPDGWDSEMQAYPWVTRVGDRMYMLYNGNGNGRDGFGLAVADV